MGKASTLSQNSTRLQWTLVFSPINRISQKDNLANTEISILIIIVFGKLSFVKGEKKISGQHVPGSPSEHRIDE